MISLIIRNADIVFVFICISQLCTCAAFFLLNILQHSACNTFWIYWEEEKNKTNHATLCGFQWLCLFFFTSLWLGLKVVCLKMLFFGQIGNGTSMFLLSLLRLVVAVFFLMSYRCRILFYLIDFEWEIRLGVPFFNQMLLFQSQAKLTIENNYTRNFLFYFFFWSTWRFLFCVGTST